MTALMYISIDVAGNQYLLEQALSNLEKIIVPLLPNLDSKKISYFKIENSDFEADLALPDTFINNRNNLLGIYRTLVGITNAIYNSLKKQQSTLLNNKDNINNKFDLAILIKTINDYTRQFNSLVDKPGNDDNSNLKNLYNIRDKLNKFKNDSNTITSYKNSNNDFTSLIEELKTLLLAAKELGNNLVTIADAIKLKNNDLKSFKQSSNISAVFAENKKLFKYAINKLDDYRKSFEALVNNFKISIKNSSEINEAMQTKINNALDMFLNSFNEQLDAIKSSDETAKKLYNNLISSIGNEAIDNNQRAKDNQELGITVIAIETKIEYANRLIKLCKDHVLNFKRVSQILKLTNTDYQELLVKFIEYLTTNMANLLTHINIINYYCKSLPKADAKTIEHFITLKTNKQTFSIKGDSPESLANHIISIAHSEKSTENDLTKHFITPDEVNSLAQLPSFILNTSIKKYIETVSSNLNNLYKALDDFKKAVETKLSNTNIASNLYGSLSTLQKYTNSFNNVYFNIVSVVKGCKYFTNLVDIKKFNEYITNINNSEFIKLITDEEIDLSNDKTVNDCLKALDFLNVSLVDNPAELKISYLIKSDSDLKETIRSNCTARFISENEFEKLINEIGQLYNSINTAIKNIVSNISDVPNKYSAQMTVFIESIKNKIFDEKTIMSNFNNFEDIKSIQDFKTFLEEILDSKGFDENNINNNINNNSNWYNEWLNSCNNLISELNDSFLTNNPDVDQQSEVQYIDSNGEISTDTNEIDEFNQMTTEQQNQYRNDNDQLKKHITSLLTMNDNDDSFNWRQALANADPESFGTMSKYSDFEKYLIICLDSIESTKQSRLIKDSEQDWAATLYSNLTSGNGIKTFEGNFKVRCHTSDDGIVEIPDEPTEQIDTSLIVESVKYGYFQKVDKSSNYKFGNTVDNFYKIINEAENTKNKHQNTDITNILNNYIQKNYSSTAFKTFDDYVHIFGNFMRRNYKTILQGFAFYFYSMSKIISKKNNTDPSKSDNRAAIEKENKALIAMTRSYLGGVAEQNADTIDDIRSLGKINREKRDYQVDFVSKVVKFLKNAKNRKQSVLRNRSILGVAPCGSGKTSMMSAIITYMLYHNRKQSNKSKYGYKVIVVAHNDEILQQIKSDLKNYVNCEVIRTAAQFEQLKNVKYAVLILSMQFLGNLLLQGPAKQLIKRLQNLADYSLPKTNLKIKEHSEKLLNIEKFVFNGFMPNLIIIDECHRSENNTYQSIIKFFDALEKVITATKKLNDLKGNKNDIAYVNHLYEYYSTVKPELQNKNQNYQDKCKALVDIASKFKNITPVMLLGFTATPERTSSTLTKENMIEGLANSFSHMVEAPCADDLIKLGYLAPYKYYSTMTHDQKTNINLVDKLKTEFFDLTLNNESDKGIPDEKISTDLAKCIASINKSVFPLYNNVANAEIEIRCNFANGTPIEFRNVVINIDSVNEVNRQLRASGKIAKIPTDNDIKTEMQEVNVSKATDSDDLTQEVESSDNMDDNTTQHGDKQFLESYHINVAEAVKNTKTARRTKNKEDQLTVSVKIDDKNTSDLLLTFTDKNNNNVAVVRDNNSVPRLIQLKIKNNKIYKVYYGKAVCYCVGIQAAKDLAKSLNNWYGYDKNTDEKDFKNVTQTGSTPTNIRNQVIEEMKKPPNETDLRIICNVEIIAEGVNIPNLNAVIMLRPTNSLRLFIQQSTRCLRTSKDKEKAIIIDAVGNINKFGSPTADREWNLTNAVKLPIISRRTKTCPSCGYSPLHISNIQCPECGYEFKKDERSNRRTTENNSLELSQILMITNAEKYLKELVTQPSNKFKETKDQQTVEDISSFSMITLKEKTSQNFDSSCDIGKWLKQFTQLAADNNWSNTKTACCLLNIGFFNDILKSDNTDKEIVDNFKWNSDNNFLRTIVENWYIANGSQKYTLLFTDIETMLASEDDDKENSKSNKFIAEFRFFDLAKYRSKENNGLLSPNILTEKLTFITLTLKSFLNACCEYKHFLNSVYDIVDNYQNVNYFNECQKKAEQSLTDRDKKLDELDDNTVQNKINQLENTINNYKENLALTDTIDNIRNSINNDQITSSDIVNKLIMYCISQVKMPDIKQINDESTIEITQANETPIENQRLTVDKSDLKRVSFDLNTVNQLVKDFFIDMGIDSSGINTSTELESLVIDINNVRDFIRIHTEILKHFHLDSVINLQHKLNSYTSTDSTDYDEDNINSDIIELLNDATNSIEKTLNARQDGSVDDKNNILNTLITSMKSITNRLTDTQPINNAANVITEFIRNITTKNFKDNSERINSLISKAIQASLQIQPDQKEHVSTQIDSLRSYAKSMMPEDDNNMDEYLKNLSIYGNSQSSNFVKFNIAKLLNNLTNLLSMSDSINSLKNNINDLLTNNESFQLYKNDIANTKQQITNMTQQLDMLNSESTNLNDSANQLIKYSENNNNDSDDKPTTIEAIMSLNKIITTYQASSDSNKVALSNKLKNIVKQLNDATENVNDATDEVKSAIDESIKDINDSINTIKVESNNIDETVKAKLRQLLANLSKLNLHDEKLDLYKITDITVQLDEVKSLLTNNPTELLLGTEIQTILTSTNKIVETLDSSILANFRESIANIKNDLIDITKSSAVMLDNVLKQLKTLANQIKSEKTTNTINDSITNLLTIINKHNKQSPNNANLQEVKNYLETLRKNMLLKYSIQLPKLHSQLAHICKTINDLQEMKVDLVKEDDLIQLEKFKEETLNINSNTKELSVDEMRLINSIINSILDRLNLNNVDKSIIDDTKSSIIDISRSIDKLSTIDTSKLVTAQSVMVTKFYDELIKPYCTIALANISILRKQKSNQQFEQVEQLNDYFNNVNDICENFRNDITADSNNSVNIDDGKYTAAIKDLTEEINNVKQSMKLNKTLKSFVENTNFFATIVNKILEFLKEQNNFIINNNSNVEITDRYKHFTLLSIKLNTLKLQQFMFNFQLNKHYACSKSLNKLINDITNAEKIESFVKTILQETIEAYQNGKKIHDEYMTIYSKLKANLSNEHKQSNETIKLTNSYLPFLLQLTEILNRKKDLRLERLKYNDLIKTRKEICAELVTAKIAIEKNQKIFDRIQKRIGPLIEDIQKKIDEAVKEQSKVINPETDKSDSGEINPDNEVIDIDDDEFQ